MCRVEVVVPASYEHGDQVRCGSCGTGHRVLRGDRVRLVLADVSALREEVRAAEERAGQIEADLQRARGSIGIGVNGLAVGLAYLLWQIGLADQTWAPPLLWRAAGLSLVSGVLLELANYLFLAKRQAMIRLSEDLEQARADLRLARQRLRDASRV
jgi:hypothetical protein